MSKVIAAMVATGGAATVALGGTYLLNGKSSTNSRVEGTNNDQPTMTNQQYHLN